MPYGKRTPYFAEAATQGRQGTQPALSLSKEAPNNKTIICLNLFDFARICQNRFEPVPKLPV
jgi:hypothetical protein